MDATNDKSTDLFSDETIVREEVMARQRGKQKYVVYSEEDSNQLQE